MSENKRIALVTGANKGIGFETVRQLAQKGFIVLIGVRNEQRGREAESKLKAEGLDVRSIQLDLEDKATYETAFEFIKEEFGKLDVLVNNAGVNLEWDMIPVAELDVEIWRKTLETNFFGVLQITQKLLPLLHQSEAGRIVNVSSKQGSLTLLGNPEFEWYDFRFPAYSFSKTALNALTVLLGRELQNTKVKVNSICPGWVKTDMGSENAPRTTEQAAKIIVEMATIGKDGSNGGFYDDDGKIDW